MLFKAAMFFLIGGAALSRHWQPAALTLGIWLAVWIGRRGRALLNAR